MNSELATPEISTSIDTSAAPKRQVRRALVVALVGVLGLAACTSDPSARRVAEDIIKTGFIEGDLTEVQRDCMLDRLDAYSDDELSDITASAGDAGPGTAIELFEADLAACK